MKRTPFLIVLILLGVALVLVPAVWAQDANVEITGTVESVAAGVIVIDGLTVNIEAIDATTVAQIGIGARVTVTGTLQDNEIIAISVTILPAPEATAPVDPPETSVQVNGYIVNFSGRITSGNSTTFTYLVTGTGVPPDLSHFDIEIPTCDIPLEVIAYSPMAAVEFGVDPTTGIDGIKWDTGLDMSSSRTYSITFAGDIAAGPVLVAVKGGPGYEALSLPGPSCREETIDVEKSVSVDGATWMDADAAPGADVLLDGEVFFLFSVRNTGNTEVTGVTLGDDTLDLSGCIVPTSLAPDAFFDCVVGPLPVEAGQHVNTATVQAIGADTNASTSDSDMAYYYGGPRPSVTIDKTVSADGSVTWADSAAVELGASVFFRLLVTNDGTAPLSGFSLADDHFDTGGCTLPETLDPEATFECVLGPIEVTDTQHTNTSTISASYADITVTASDSASYAGEEDLDVTITVEGPVEAINGSVIVIYGIDFALDPNDPLLVSVEIGDILRIEGGYSNNVIVVVVAIIIVDIDAIVIEINPEAPNTYITDPECANPPPPWAPANGWRRKCEGR